MLRSKFIFIMAVLLTTGQIVLAQIKPMMLAPVREISPVMSARQVQLTGNLQPSARAWLEQQGHAEAKKQSPNIQGLKAAISSRFGSGQPGARAVVGGLSDADIESIAFIVLMIAAKDAQEDLKQVMAGVKAIAEAKKKMREQIANVKNEIKKAAGRKGIQEKCAPPTCQPIAGLAVQFSKLSKRPLRFNATDQMTYGQANEALEEMKNNLETEGDVADADQLKIQMLSDRRTQLEESASNAMKKLSDSSSTIIQNIK